jgi:hypothetical protein
MSGTWLSQHGIEQNTKELPLRLQVETLQIQYGVSKPIPRLHVAQRRQNVSIDSLLLARPRRMKPGGGFARATLAARPRPVDPHERIRCSLAQTRRWRSLKRAPVRSKRFAW